MRFLYADPALHSDLGHHANACRFITRELRRRGIQPTVLAHATIEPALGAELGARAHFRGFSYFLNDGDPFCGWLSAFHDVSAKIRDDLAPVDIRQDDLVFFNSVQPGVMMGVIAWLTGLPPDRLPRVVMEFGTEPGAEILRGPKGTSLGPRDPRIDARSTLYRFAGRQITAKFAARLQMVTFEDNSSAAYSALLNKPVGVLPFPHQATTARRNRSGTRPLTVAAIGHQRPDKGYQLMPAVARLLLQSHGDIRILAHNGDRRTMAATQQAMRDLAATDRRVSVDDRLADPTIWAELLDASDLIVCPYPPDRYALGYSAVVVEAIANAIPVVVPAGTALSRLLHEFGGPGTTFADHTAAAVAAAAEEALRQYDRLAQLASSAAERWTQKNGPGRVVDAILSLGRAPDAQGTTLVRYPTVLSID